MINKQTTLDLNGPILSFTQQPQSVTTNISSLYTGNTIQVSTTYNGYPVRGYLYFPTTSGLSSSLDVVVLYHGTITSGGVSPLDAASTFIDIALNRIYLKDKLIFSVAYPQDFIPLWNANPSLPAAQFPGLDYPNFYLGDNIVYAEAALLWVKNNLNSYLSSNNIPKTTNKVYTFGHSQGAYLVHRLNTMHTVDGVISNAPGPIDLLTRCSGVQQTATGSCNKIGLGIGLTSTDPDAYNSRSLKSFLSGTLSPTLFTQALDDDTADEFGTPQVANMQDIVQVGLSTCTDCNTIKFNYYENGGHDAFVTNTILQRDIRSFVGSSGGGSVTFVGVATATFPTQDPSNPSTNSGVISYRWYDQNGPLINSQNVIGSSSTTLTLGNITSPGDNGRRVYLKADYVPSAYGLTGVAVTVGSARSTGNASNDALNSNTAVLSVNSLITITRQPSSSTVIQGQSTTFRVSAITSDGTSTGLSYQWLLNGAAIQDSSTVRGATTPTLTISSSNIGSYAIRVRITHPTSSNSPLLSNSVQFGVVAPPLSIVVETINDDSATASVQTYNLETNNNITLLGRNYTSRSTLFSLYAPNRDVNVEMDVYGGKGANYGGFQGGLGGFVRIRFTMKQNEEYVIAGLNNVDNCPFVYRKGQLIAVVGTGGNASSRGPGGNGGGIGPGSNAPSVGTQRGGSGALYFGSGFVLPTFGTLGSTSSSTPIPPDNKVTGNSGGRVANCSRGDYWRNLGFSPCQDLGNIKFFNKNGREITNTAKIDRGFKAGYSTRQTAGAGAPAAITTITVPQTCTRVVPQTCYREVTRTATYSATIVDTGPVAGNPNISISGSNFIVSRGSGRETSLIGPPLPNTSNLNLATVYTILVNRLGPGFDGITLGQGDDYTITISNISVNTASDGSFVPGIRVFKQPTKWTFEPYKFDVAFVYSDPTSWYFDFFSQARVYAIFPRSFTVTVSRTYTELVPFDCSTTETYDCSYSVQVPLGGGGHGGNGAGGGQGGQAGVGGGGGSGFIDRSVQLLGSNTGVSSGARVVIRSV